MHSKKYYLKKKNIFEINYTIFYLILILILTRIFFYSLGLKSGDHIPHMWQLLSPDLLDKDYFRSLLYLHYQPPLWNSFY